MASRSFDVYQAAERLFDEDPDWVTFFNKILGVNGVVRAAFPDRESLAQFELTNEYAAIQMMIAKLRERSGASIMNEEPTRVITIRLPQSLHDALTAEAAEYRTTFNKLCISKLLQMVRDDVVPPDDGRRPLSLYFDLADFRAADIAEVISALSDLYREIGGDGLVIDGMQLIDPVPIPVPV